MRSALSTLPLVILLVALSACGGTTEAPDKPADTPPAASSSSNGGSDEASNPSPQDALADAMDQLQETFGENGQRASAPVNFRDLRALVPEDAAGLNRSEMEGATEGAMGLSISRVEATFVDDDGASVDVAVVDLGTFPQLGMFGLGWTSLTIDRESSDGYERTTRFEGYPAFEQVNGERAEIQVIVVDRFLVSAKGRVSMDTLHDLIRAHDLDALAAMRDVNVEA